MGVLLRGAGGDFVLNNFGWGTLLRLAFERGWRPSGTLPPPHWNTPIPDEPWHSWNQIWNSADYFSCRGQIMTARDAQGVAAALAGIMDDLPNHEPEQETIEEGNHAPGFPDFRAVRPNEQPNPFEVFAGENKTGFRAFLSFCTRGSFAIW